MSVINVNVLAETMLVFTLLPSINLTNKEDNYVVDKNGAKPALVHQDNEYIVMWVDEDFCTIKDFSANSPEEALKLAYNWCVDNNLIVLSNHNK